ncbi:serine/threonine protein kinase [Paenibacillus humicola]|uniref:serine/threonine protein kinase n=1 Tax=Paenibacillus humicola TaxID=3110540 RepID=UPI00237B5747|nr:serine/threonine-protein kinase [Paenibacillus humicola]
MNVSNDFIEGVSFEIGSVIGGRYRIAGMIGRGGMGEVYAAEDLRLQGKLRALKVNKPPTADGLYGAEEASLLMRLSHPRLPQIVDYFPPGAGGSEMLVTDYIDGVTLQSFMASRGGALRPAEALDAAVQLCDALHYLHRQQPPVIHRDLKPTNVMIDRAGYVRLIDFGIARSFKAGQAGDTVQLGTPGFAAPEQEGRRQSDARTDVYGLGALLDYLLSGVKRPLDAEARPGSGSPASRLLPQTASVIAVMTDARPEVRYASMAKAEEALMACLEAEKKAEAAGGRASRGSGGLHAGIGGRSRLSSSPASGETPPGYNRPDADAFPKQRRIAVASLSSGAGATFAAVTLARLLAARGISCAAVEHPAVEPEWLALLDLAGKKPDAGGAAGPLDPRYIRVQAGGVLWHALQPSQEAAGADDALKFRLMTEALRQSVVITDFSSRWVEEAAREQLLGADELLFVADPFPSKWTPVRVRKAQALSFERSKAGLATVWLANKDCRFRGRPEWLAMLPSKPSAVVPLLPQERWLDFIWLGLWATDERGWMNSLQSAFGPLADRVFAPS